MINFLKEKIKKDTLILGVGNIMRKDDGLGSIFVSRNKGKYPFKFLDLGVAPENFLEKIVKLKPKSILVIDAVDFKGKPGEIKIFSALDLETDSIFFTHNSSLRLFINYLKEHLTVDIIILAIQPKTVEFGQGLSPEVEKALEIIKEELKEV